MKSFLLLCLLSLFAGKLDILSTGVCLITNPKVMELGSKVLGYIKSKDFDSIIPTLINPEMASLVKDCLKYKNEDVDNATANDEITLKDKIRYKCYDSEAYQKCIHSLGTSINFCLSKYCIRR